MTTERRGREKLHFVNGEPLREIAEGWIARYPATQAEPATEWVDWHDAFNQP